MGISKEHNELGRRWLSLRTIPVILEHKGRELIVNALLDDASTTSYVSLDVANELGLRGKRRILPIEVIGGRTQEIESQEVKMTLKSTSGDLTKIFKALALSTVTGDMKVIDWRVARRSWAHLGHIQFPAASKRITVDVLIGSDYPDLQRALEEVSGIEGGPIARLTPLGWTCIGGPWLGTSLNHQKNFIKTFLSMENKLDDNIRKFWEIEEAVGPSENSKKDRELIDLSRKTIAKTEVGYEVALPWKNCKEQLPDSRLLAEQRLASLCKKLDKEPELRIAYEGVIADHEEKGYIKRIKTEELRTKGWLLPHFAVVKKDGDKTKIRIVFDAAAKSQGMCLNDALETGPNLQNDVVEVLVRFRRHRIALSCDVQEMFLRVGVTKEDRRYLRFLWERDGKIIVYEFQRLVFGLNTSPFLAQLIARENAQRFEKECPRAVETIKKIHVYGGQSRFSRIRVRSN